MHASRSARWAILTAAFSSACGAPAITPPDSGLLFDAGVTFDSGTAAPDGGALPSGIFALSGYEPGLPDDDLAPLGALIGNRTVVGIGESVHTSGGYQLSRARVMRYLIERKGFRLIAIEWQRTSGAVVEDYLINGNRTAAAATSTLSVWSSQEDADLLAWVRSFNQSHPADAVHFIGFDTQQPGSDRATLQAFLAPDGGIDQPSLAAPLSQCDIGQGLTGGMLTYLGDLAACTQGLDGIDTYVASNGAALIAATSADRVLGAQLASIGLRAWQGEAFYYTSDVTQSYEWRDVGMAEEFRRLREARHPGAKTIVWAHNYHLRRAGAGVTGLGAVGAKTMGTLVAANLGDDYFPIAQLGYDVDIDWPGVGCGPTSVPPAQSVPGLLNAVPSDTLLVDLSFPGAAAPFFSAGRSYGESQYETLVPAEQYRAVIFLKYSPKMTPLSWPSCR